MEVKATVGALRVAMRKLTDVYTDKQLNDDFTVFLMSQNRKLYLGVDFIGLKLRHVVLGVETDEDFEYALKSGHVLDRFVKSYGDRKLFYFADDDEHMIINVDEDIEMISIQEGVSFSTDVSKQTISRVKVMDFFFALEQVKGFGRKSFNELTEKVTITMNKSYLSLSSTDFISLNMCSIKQDYSGEVEMTTKFAVEHRQAAKLYKYLESMKKMHKDEEYLTLTHCGETLLVSCESYEMAILVEVNDIGLDLTYFRNKLLSLKGDSWDELDIQIELDRADKAISLLKDIEEEAVLEVNGFPFGAKRLKTYLKAIQANKISTLLSETGLICKYQEENILYFGFVSGKRVQH